MTLRCPACGEPMELVHVGKHPIYGCRCLQNPREDQVAWLRTRCEELAAACEIAKNTLNIKNICPELQDRLRTTLRNYREGT